MRTESDFFVLAWDGDGYRDEPLHTTRTLLIVHEIGANPSRADVIDAFDADANRGHYAAGKYRIYPARDVVDVEVTSTVKDCG